MATRRDSREWAVQLLFQLDMNPAEKIDEVFSEFWEGKTADGAAKEFTEKAVAGVQDNLSDIDQLLEEYAQNWDVARMGVLDRSVMRLALYEMKYNDDVPDVVAINEAVDLAKYFSSADSGKFVNGILDRARKDLEK